MTRHKCPDCGADRTGPGRCMEHFAREEKEKAAKDNYLADMALLSFIREGGTQAEYARHIGVSRQRVHTMLIKANQRTALVHQLILDGEVSLDRIKEGASK